MYPFWMRFYSIYKFFVMRRLCRKHGSFSAGNAFGPRAGEPPLLSAVLVADLHTDGDPARDRNVVLTRLFAGVAKRTPKADALIVAGDITNAANYREYGNLEGMLGIFRPAKRLLASSGNHDVGGGTSDDRDYGVSMRRYYEFCGRCGFKTDKPYATARIGGYLFVVIGSEARLNDCAKLTDTQLTWLDGVLKAAEGEGKPVFLIGHQAIGGTHGTSESADDARTVGEASRALRAVIETHTAAGLTLLYVSGHMHADFSARSFENPSPGFYCLNLPSALYSAGGGRGVCIEVSADAVRLYARDLIAGVWLPQTWEIPLGRRKREE